MVVLWVGGCGAGVGWVGGVGRRRSILFMLGGLKGRRPVI